METINKIYVKYDDLFVDELTIKLLYEQKGRAVEYVDESGRPIEKHRVIEWVLGKYFVDDKFKELRYKYPGRKFESEYQLYQFAEEYRRIVDEERMYILYLVGIEVTKVANLFEVSRQTVYNRINSFEEKRLPEILNRFIWV